MQDINITAVVTNLTELATLYIPKLLLALFTLIVGLWLVSKLTMLLRRALTNRKVDPSLAPFLSSIIKIVLVVMLIISVAGMVGIETTSFIAVLGAAGLAIGLALQGSLSNFAGGVLILFLKPFRVGEVIEAQGLIGTVTEIQIFHTYMLTFDKKVIIIPNGPLANNNIVNYSREKSRMVEWVFGISYSDSIDQARSIIREVIFSDPRVLNVENPYINVLALADSSVNIRVRAEVLQENYWQMFFDMNERVKKAFDAQGITIPFPQRTLHIQQAPSQQLS
ncbi:mechanosensitive ion channel family protein [Cesiribacter andamanensis]|uniref:Small-conductance mechanosensitive channel n=1 Tax=Cesiribacter andamanensis AMV16 TaxID=1279009 RepID=M7NAM9_9BACT|nr:mechanosensitive ion channel domain-containing protein [Cesiribacter andamanensis]EMR04302.1 Small-conductance mechanosensitive channel [Cesiribacter andamanensis AMV16]